MGFEITSFTLKRDPGAGFSLCEGRVCVADVCVRAEDNSVLFLKTPCTLSYLFVFETGSLISQKLIA